MQQTEALLGTIETKQHNFPKSFIMKNILLLFLLGFLGICNSGFSQQIRPSIHQEQMEHYNSLGIPANDYNKINKTVLRPPSTNKQQACTLDKIVYGWHPYWENGNEVNYDWDRLSHLCYFGYDVNASTGNALTTNGWATASPVTAALNNGKKVHLCVTLFSSHATFFGSSNAQQTLINNLISLIQSRGAHGINIDFEGVPSSYRTNLTNFIISLSNQMKAAIPNSELTIALYAVDWGNVFDIPTLKNYIDLFVIMGYDYHWTGSAQAGPNDPLYWYNSTGNSYDYNLSRSVTFYLAQGLPKSQLCLGLPYYGREWPTVGSGFYSNTTGSGSARIYDNVRNNSSGVYSAANKSWNTTGRTDRYTYNNGSWRQCFISMESAIQERMDFINKRGLAGMGIWALGYDNGYSEFWDAIQDNFTDCQEDPCTGGIHDMGGLSRNYYNNEDYTYTIDPPGASSVSMTFSLFDLETDYDFLYLYDGPGVNSPIIGTYTGTNSPGTVVANSGALTVRFTSDGGVERPGYVATYSCSQDNSAPTTTISIPGNWQTNNFTSTFTDIDNNGLDIRFYQPMYRNNSDWMANGSRGYFKDNFSASLDTRWSNYSGTWATANGALVQSDESLGNTILTATVNQNGADAYLYNWNASIGGSGTNRRAGLHFMCDDPDAPNRGNSYFVYFRVDTDVLQIYKVTNDVFSLEASFPLTVNVNQNYNHRVVYEKSSGTISVYRAGNLVGEWIDPAPLTSGDYVSFRSGNCTYTVPQFDVFKKRGASTVIRVGNAATDDIIYQNINPGTPAGRIRSIVLDAANNFSTTASADVDVDWTPPSTVLVVNDGTGLDEDVSNATSQLFGNWGNSIDNNSGVVKYWYKIGTAPGLGNIVALTDNGLSTSFTESGLTLINGQMYYITVQAENGAGLMAPFASSDGMLIERDVQIQPKVLLGGCYDMTTGLMKDNLRGFFVLPTSQPYTAAPWSYNGGETTTTTVLSLTGNNAIIDWVLVELRAAADPSTVIATRAALLQADGDVVDTDGVSPITFNAAAGNYKVAIHHRNHLSVSSLNSFALGTAPNYAADFRSIPTYGTAAQETMGGVSVLWSGDANADGLIDASDRSTVWNDRNTNGYLLQDVDMNGAVDASDRSACWNHRNRAETMP